MATGSAQKSIHLRRKRFPLFSLVVENLLKEDLEQPVRRDLSYCSRWVMRAQPGESRGKQLRDHRSQSIHQRSYVIEQYGVSFPRMEKQACEYVDKVVMVERKVKALGTRTANCGLGV